ncbi:MAG: acetyl-CoA C-acetyltransferase [Gemmataceae bacterium]
MDVYLLSAVRTPIGKFLGELSDVPAPKLAAPVIAEAVRRAGAMPDQIDEVIVGNVVQAGVGQAPARQAALAAGLPHTIAAYAVNKVCGSGLKAVMLAAQAVKAGDASLVVAGGMESMSNAPHLLMNSRRGWKYGDQTTVDSLIRDGLWCAFENCAMGDSAESIASKCGVSRAEQDRFSAASHQKAASAWERGDFNEEVVPVVLPRKTVNRDEGIRAESTAEALAKLRPAFKPDGTVTAGNASQLSDGAAACVVASHGSAEKLGAAPLARIVSYAVSGVAPKDIFIAPVSAMQAAVAKAGLALADIDLIELNEAFAAQMLACGKALNWDESKVNVNGGGIALGHPIGASGTRVLVTLVHALRKRNLRYGLASLCLGGGNAVAMVIERM